MRNHALLLFLLLSLWPSPARAREEPATAPTLSADALMQHVRWLAHADRRGRGDWASRKETAAYIQQAFAGAGLVALPGQGGMYLDKPGPARADGAPAIAHRNVAAWIPVGEKPTEDYIILSAHYDHLGAQKKGDAERTFPGADDNATGIAALLEIARACGAASLEERAAWRRSLVFVAFDLEEQNLTGSKDFVKRSPLPLSGCAAFVTMDMLGRSLADLIDGSLFVMGTENSAALDALVRAGPEPEAGKRVVLGIDLQPAQSDYVPFRDAKVPYVFLTSGACADYHRPTDVVARIQPAHLAARAAWIRRLTGSLLRMDTRPVWREGAPPSVGEIQGLQQVLQAVATKLPGTPGMPPQALTMLTNFLGFIETVLADGVVTEAERKNVRNTTLMLFRFAQSAAGPR